MLRCPRGWGLWPGGPFAVPTGAGRGKDLGSWWLERSCLQGPCCQVLTTEQQSSAWPGPCGPVWPSRLELLGSSGRVTRIRVKVHLEWRAQGVGQGSKGRMGTLRVLFLP